MTIIWIVLLRDTVQIVTNTVLQVCKLQIATSFIICQLDKSDSIVSPKCSPGVHDLRETVTPWQEHRPAYHHFWRSKTGKYFQSLLTDLDPSSPAGLSSTNIRPEPEESRAAFTFLFLLSWALKTSQVIFNLVTLVHSVVTRPHSS